MDASTLLLTLFPYGHHLYFEGHIFCGQARVRDQSITVLGTREQSPIGVELAHRLAGATLASVRQHPGQPILLLIDTSGQRLSHRDELLGLNGYMAHLAECLNLARRTGCRTLALVYNQCVSGGFLATSLMADDCYALPGAQVQVMNLQAMSRVMRIPLQRLEELSQTSPVLAPGVDVFFRMGAIREIWTGDPLAALIEALSQPSGADRRRVDGELRGGRTHAQPISKRVRHGEF